MSPAATMAQGGTDGHDRQPRADRLRRPDRCNSHRFAIAFLTLTLLGNYVPFSVEMDGGSDGGACRSGSTIAGIFGRIGQNRTGPNKPSKMGLVGWFDVKAAILNSIDVVFFRRNASQSR